MSGFLYQVAALSGVYESAYKDYTQKDATGVNPFITIIENPLQLAAGERAIISVSGVCTQVLDWFPQVIIRNMVTLATAGLQGCNMESGLNNSYCIQICLSNNGDGTYFSVAQMLTNAESFYNCRTNFYSGAWNFDDPFEIELNFNLSVPSSMNIKFITIDKIGA